MKKTFVIAVAVVVLGVPSLGFAQFGGALGGQIGGLLGNKSSSNASADLGAQQDQLVGRYVAAGKDVLTANTHLAGALGIQAQGVNAAATSDSFSASDIEAQDKAISANAAAVSEALKSGVKLTDSQAKAEYATGLLSLATGLKKYMDMRKDVQGFSSGLSGVSALQLPKLQSGAYIVTNLPGSVTSLSTVLKSAVDFAMSNGIEVPRDATSLL